MPRPSHLLPAGLAILVLAGPAAAGVLYVDGSDPTCGGRTPCHTAIQPAIDAAARGDTVQVAPGTYAERLHIEAKQELLVEGAPAAAPGSVVIDPSTDPSLAECLLGAGALEVGASSQITLRRLAITGYAGHGVRLRGGSEANDAVTLDGLRVVGNGQGDCGNGIHVEPGNADTVLAHNVVIANVGSGIAFHGLPPTGEIDEPLLWGNTLFRNGAHGVLVSGFHRPVLTNNLVLQNDWQGELAGVARDTTGLAIPVTGSDMVLRHNMLCGNGGPEIELAPTETPIASGNLTPSGSEGAGFAASPGCSIAVNLFEDGAGTDNLWATLDDDYFLKASSPAVDAGTAPGPYESAPLALLQRDHLRSPVRPADGDDDGSLDYDIGAHEYGVAPTVAIASPVDGSVSPTSEPAVAGTFTGTSPLSLKVEGGVPTQSGGTFETSLLLAEGSNTISATATNAFGSATAVVGVTLPPLEIAIASPGDGSTTDASSATISGSVNDAAALVAVNGIAATVAGNQFEADVALGLLTNSVLATAVRGASSASDRIEVIRASEPVPPPAPPVAEAAPPLDPTEASEFGRSIEFLYRGENPAQSFPPIVDEDGDPVFDEDGHPATPFEEHRVSVVRGYVSKADGSPLGGARISAKDHPEYGHTTSRADGSYDLAVNGGGSYTIDYAYPGRIPAQRLVTVPWRDFEIVDDVVLLPFDVNATPIQLGSGAAQVARGAVSTDEDGARQATVFFPPGLSAVGRRPDGSTVSLASLTVRLTEFTVGERGQEAMPASLPASSGYTYATELSVDEAVAEGASTVEFDPPVVFYLENFLDLPTGIIVPVGFYDYEQATWVPEENGVVLRIDAIVDGLAVVDPDPGLSDEERALLASLYAPGDELWRAERSHFSPMDPNYPAGFFADARAPSPEGTEDGKPPWCPTSVVGSVIEVETQVLGEEIGLAQTPYSLHYRSNRVIGYAADRSSRVPLTDDDPPASMKRVDVRVDVAGKRETFSFDPEPNLPPFTYTWDGLDGYGRRVFGGVPASVELGWVYEMAIGEPRGTESFGRTTDQYTERSARDEGVVWKRFPKSFRQLDARGWGIGGWTLDAHHYYDTSTQTLYRGDGVRRDVSEVSKVMNLVAGGPKAVSVFTTGIPGPASEVRFGGNRISGLAAAPDGSIYIAEAPSHSSIADRVYKIDRDGWMSYVTGPQTASPDLDKPALDTRVGQISDIATGPDGDLFILERTSPTPPYVSRILRIDREGEIRLFAGGDDVHADVCSTDIRLQDGTSAEGAALCIAVAGASIEVGPDGSVYFSLPNYSGDAGWIRRVRPDGELETVVYSDGSPGQIEGEISSGLVGRAIEHFTLDPRGRVYFSSRYTGSIYSVRPEDGVVEIEAGGGSPDDGVGDGLPALEAEFNRIDDLAFAPDGVLYVSEVQVDGSPGAVRGFLPGGVIRAVAGNGSRGSSGDGGPSLQASLTFGGGRLEVAPNGAVLFTQPVSGGILPLRSVTPPVPLVFEEITVPAQSGGDLYDFDRSGRHQRTRSALTGAVLSEFRYDASGRLVEARSLAPSGSAADDQVTTIERDASGHPTAIVGPFGARTALGVDANGYLASVRDPAGGTHLLESTETGLLTAFTTPTGGEYAFHYDALGKLILDEDAEDGFQSLAVTDESQGVLEVTLETALGRAETRRTEVAGDGGLEWTFTDKAGFETTRYTSQADLATSVYPDGSSSTAIFGSEPRFGLLAPLATERRMVSGQSERLVTHARSAAVDSTGTLESQQDTVAVNGRETQVDWDGPTRTQTVTSPEGRQTVGIFDAQGRPLETELVGLEPVAFGYDDRGRLVSASQGVGAEERLTTFGFDDDGDLVSITDPVLRSVTFTHDDAGRVETITLPGSRVVEYDYDPSGNLTLLKPPGQPAHVFRYTHLDQESEYEPPAVDANDPRTLYSFDLDRALTDVDRPDGSFVELRYENDTGRLETLTLPRGTTSFGYSPSTGQLVSLMAPGGEGLDFSYDGFLPTGTVWSGSVAGSVSQSFDDDFRVDAQWVNGAFGVSYLYDDDGLIEAAGALDVGLDPDTGLVASTALGSAATSHAYNGFGELASESASAGATSLYAASFTRDKLGRITQKVETVEGVTETLAYVYQPETGHLQHVYVNGALARSYAHDANGNRLSLTDASGTTLGSYDAQDRQNAWGSYGYSYDAAGDLTSKTDTATLATTGYSYDALGNLTQVVLPGAGGTIDYVIDAQNRRVGKKVNGVLVQGFLYQDPLNPVAELDGLGNVVSRFAYGTKAHVPDYMVKGGTTYRILSDHLGSVRLVVDASTGTVAQRIDYDEFGNVLSDSSPGFQPFGFAGGIYDPDTGLTRFGARDYDPVVGRWTTKDPIRFDGGFNLYGYVLNDPVNLIDPTGLVSSFDLKLAQAVATGNIVRIQNLLAAGGLTAQQTQQAQQAIARLQMTGQQLLSLECKASARGAFPGQFLDQTFAQIRQAASQGDAAARTAIKLLTDKRFRK